MRDHILNSITDNGRGAGIYSDGRLEVKEDSKVAISCRVTGRASITHTIRYMKFWARMANIKQMYKMYNIVQIS